MNKILFNDSTMRELLGEAWDKNSPILKNQEESLFSYRQRKAQEQEVKNFSQDDAERRAIAVLREANPVLLDVIKECAFIR